MAEMIHDFEVRNSLPLSISDFFLILVIYYILFSKNRVKRLEMFKEIKGLRRLNRFSKPCYDEHVAELRDLFVYLWE